MRVIGDDIDLGTWKDALGPLTGRRSLPSADLDHEDTLMC